MADDRNVAHDKKVASDMAKAADKDSKANVDGDGVYTTETHEKHPAQPAISRRRRKARSDARPATRWILGRRAKVIRDFKTLDGRTRRMLSHPADNACKIW